MRKAKGQSNGGRVISRKGWLVFLLLVLLSLGLSGGVRVRAAEYSGSCGRKVEWFYEASEGILRIEGSGAMYDYSDPKKVPWYEFRDKIGTVEIGKGVTSIGGGAFFSCQNLWDVRIAESVVSIGDSAFSRCKSLSKIRIPDSVSKIGSCAFQESGLRVAEIPKGVEVLTKALFCDCADLAVVKLPDGLGTIDAYAFYSCTGLKEVNVPYSVKTLGDASFRGVPAVLRLGCSQFKEDMIKRAEIEEYELVHAWSAPTYVWSSDNGTVLAARTCANDHAHDVTETAHTAATVTRQPTCEEKGETTYAASFLSNLFTRQTRTVADIDALGHDVRHQTALAATCEQDGHTDCYRCARCDACFADALCLRRIPVSSTVIPATGHDYVATVTREPTCERSGIRTYVCRHDSSHRYRETIPALGHDYVSSVTREPTCVREGVMTFTCTRDPSHKYTEPIAALGHELEHVAGVEATEETAGVLEHWHCGRCGKNYADEAGTKELTEQELVLPVLGKVYRSVLEKAPTCTEPGLMLYVNEADEADTYEESIAPLGHRLAHMNAKDPTLEEEGHVEYWYCLECHRQFADAGALTEIPRGSTAIPRLEPDRVPLMFGCAAVALFLFFLLVLLLERKVAEWRTRRRRKRERKSGHRRAELPMLLQT